MRLLTALLASTFLLSAQSNPSWWKYTPPESTAIVGIQWKNVRNTLFAGAVAAEMAPGGSLAFPNLELLKSAELVLIAGPDALAMISGNFPIAKLREQAAAEGMKRTSFQRAELWVSPRLDIHSVAYINERLLLVGDAETIREAVSRVGNPQNRAYSPLLARGARYAKEDIWVVASELPNSLANLFVPFEVEATAFEGAVSAWDGLHAVAAIERPSAMKALDLADLLAQSLASRPAMAEGTEITTRERTVLIKMDLNEDQLASSLRSPAASSAVAVANTDAPHAVSAVAISDAPAKPPARDFVPPGMAPAAATAPAVSINAAVPPVDVNTAAPAPVPVAKLPDAPQRPRTIKILGLDNGPKEIPLGQ